MRFQKLGVVAFAVCLVGLAMLCTAAWAEEKAAEPKKVEEAWFEAMKDGIVFGRSHSISEQVEYQGQPANHKVDEVTLTNQKLADGSNATTRAETWTTLDGRLLKLEYTENAKSGKTAVTAEVTGKRLTATRTVEGKTDVHVINIPDGTIVYGYSGADESFVKLMGFKQGEKREFTVFSPDTMVLETCTITAVGVRAFVHGNEEIQAYAYAEVDSDDPALKLMMIVSSDFKLLQVTASNGLRLVRVTKPTAEPGK